MQRHQYPGKDRPLLEKTVLEAPFLSYKQNTNASLNYHQQQQMRKERFQGACHN